MSKSIIHFGNRFPLTANAVSADFDHAFRNWLGGDRSEASFRPGVSVAETSDGYEFSLDLPGVSAEDVDLSVHEGRLTIRGERKHEQSSDEKTWHRVERFHGEFERVVALPKSVDSSQISANSENGVLNIWIPKSEDAQPRKIDVKSNKPQAE